MSDEDARFEKVYHINLDEIEPVVARPHLIDDVVPVEEAGDVKIDEAFLGSCNNGRIDELRLAAEILKGKKVHEGVGRRTDRHLCGSRSHGHEQQLQCVLGKLSGRDR